MQQHYETQIQDLLSNCDAVQTKGILLSNQQSYPSTEPPFKKKKVAFNLNPVVNDKVAIVKNDKIDDKSLIQSDPNVFQSLFQEAKSKFCNSSATKTVSTMREPYHSSSKTLSTVSESHHSTPRTVSSIGEPNCSPAKTVSSVRGPCHSSTKTVSSIGDSSHSSSRSVSGYSFKFSFTESGQIHDWQTGKLMLGQG